MTQLGRGGHPNRYHAIDRYPARPVKISGCLALG
jgi:hypothetical protein